MDPFAGEVRDGYVWGRGAVDMKDMCGDDPRTPPAWGRTACGRSRDVVVAFVADEEDRAHRCAVAGRRPSRAVRRGRGGRSARAGRCSGGWARRRERAGYQVAAAERGIDAPAADRPRERGPRVPAGPVHGGEPALDARTGWPTTRGRSTSPRRSARSWRGGRRRRRGAGRPRQRRRGEACLAELGRAGRRVAVHGARADHADDAQHRLQGQRHPRRSPRRRWTSAARPASPSSSSHAAGADRRRGRAGVHVAVAAGVGADRRTLVRRHAGAVDAADPARWSFPTAWAAAPTPRRSRSRASRLRVRAAGRGPRGARAGGSTASTSGYRWLGRVGATGARRLPCTGERVTGGSAATWVTDRPGRWRASRRGRCPAGRRRVQSPARRSDGRRGPWTPGRRRPGRC